MTTQERITQLETALESLPIGVTKTRDAAGNEIIYDRASIVKELDMLYSRLAIESGTMGLGLSTFTAGGASDG